jgi:predicted nucleotidyltransferase
MFKVEDKAELINLLMKHREKILSFGIERIGIFGSFSRDEMTLESDVDFYVEFKKDFKKYDNFMDLAFYLKELTGREIELVTSDSLSPYLGPTILKEVDYVIAA